MMKKFMPAQAGPTTIRCAWLMNPAPSSATRSMPPTWAASQQLGARMKASSDAPAWL
jgi:hypothetical protein